MEYDDLLIERYDIIKERIIEVEGSASSFGIYERFVQSEASFLLKIMETYEFIRDNGDSNLAALKAFHDELYAGILGENYEEALENPSVSVSIYGENIGRVITFITTEIRSLIQDAYKANLEPIVMYGELFIQMVNDLEDEELNGDENALYESLKSAVVSFETDNSEIFVAERIRNLIDPSMNFATNIIMNSDLSDVNYLYKFGEYIGVNEIETAKYLNTLSDEKIQSMADTYTNGYIDGFKVMRMDLSKKKNVNIRYNLGFERMVRASIENFRRAGLDVTLYPVASRVQDKRLPHRIGYQGTSVNKQYDYDHRFDQALYLDQKYVNRRIEVIKSTYEEYKDLAAVYAGPAVMEVFGEKDFEPVNKPEAIKMSKEQKELSIEQSMKASQITNEYVNPEETSFTIIAYPLPEIGEDYEAIFDETVVLNTLDNDKYRAIQQHLIDALDKAEWVHVVGAGDNLTDMHVNLHIKEHPESETNFENCVADVNIPLGEVFTSPRLTGTYGTLNVSSAYLNELDFKNLELDFEDGKVTGYRCSNYDNAEENKKFIEDNLLRNHDTLPIGEFAIGTNTVAYVMAQKYNILHKLPILIVEKTGPHFAIGDTCYSHSEDHKVYNPDGKEIIARENECSALRNVDISKAYFNIHTDITIPYEEIEFIDAVLPNGDRIRLIENGRFVLEGTEELNEVFE